MSVSLSLCVSVCVSVSVSEAGVRTRRSFSLLSSSPSAFPSCSLLLRSVCGVPPNQGRGLRGARACPALVHAALPLQLSSAASLLRPLLPLLKRRIPTKAYGEYDYYMDTHRLRIAVRPLFFLPRL